MDRDVPSYFVDSVLNLAYVNGVFRITLAQQGGNQDVRPEVKVLVPANQLNIILNGIAKAAGDIGQQLEQKAKNETAGAEASKPKKTARSQRRVSKPAKKN